jgi:DNA invertase Pin-like site-specific DNA recombinase
MTTDNPTIRKSRRVQSPQPSPAQDSELTTYYETISAMGKAAMTDKKAKGECMHLAPLGWLNARDDKGRSIIVPDPERYELVQEAKRLRAEGMSIRKICRHLEKKGFQTKRGKSISPASLWKYFQEHTKGDV